MKCACAGKSRRKRINESSRTCGPANVRKLQETEDLIRRKALQGLALNLARWSFWQRPGNKLSTCSLPSSGRRYQYPPPCPTSTPKSAKKCGASPFRRRRAAAPAPQELRHSAARPPESRRKAPDLLRCPAIPSRTLTSRKRIVNRVTLWARFAPALSKRRPKPADAVFHPPFRSSGLGIRNSAERGSEVSWVIPSKSGGTN